MGFSGSDFDGLTVGCSEEGSGSDFDGLTVGWSEEGNGSDFNGLMLVTSTFALFLPGTVGGGAWEVGNFDWVTAAILVESSV